MPDRVTVFRWLRMKNAESFRNQYESALQSRADALAEDVLDISDDATNDCMEILDKDGEVVGYRANGEVVQRSRLRVDSRNCFSDTPRCGHRLLGAADQRGKCAQRWWATGVWAGRDPWRR
jgi:hypothetical protein